MYRSRLLIFTVGICIALAWGGIRYLISAPVEVPAEVDTSEPENITVTLKQPGNVMRREIVLMGSLFSFAIAAETSAAEAALDAVIERMHELETELSSWRQGSDIYRLNAAAGKRAVSVGKATFTMLQLAKQYQVKTHGAFDVTIGPVWDLWPFRDPRRAIPTRQALDAALPLVNSSAIVLDSAAQTAYLPMAGMSVNLGAIGKGFAAQVAIDTLAEHGITNAAVSAGGDLYLRGRKQDGPWIVEIEHPRWPGRYLERFAAADIAVATSGDSKRLLVREGNVYGHIIDPRTGEPASGTQSVTILTADPVMADVYATAVSVMGPEEGMRWIEQQDDVEALIIDANGLAHRSSGWQRGIHQSRVRASEIDPSLIPEFEMDDTVIVGGRLTRKHADKPVDDFADRSPVSSDVPETPRIHNQQPLNLSAGNMVFVPGGEFVSSEQYHGYTQPFHLDRTEVTNSAYARFLKTVLDDPHRYCHPDEPPGKDHTPRYWNKDWQPALLRRQPAGTLAPFDLETFRVPEKPVVGVDWWDAYAFCHWAGKRLPTRVEWTKAAGGIEGWRWPWGNDWDPGRANSGGEMNAERDGYTYAAPADAFKNGASVYGNLNMAGNVAEWTAEGFTMGGSSTSSPSGVVTTAARQRDAGYRSFDAGFRAVAGNQ